VSPEPQGHSRGVKVNDSVVVALLAPISHTSSGIGINLLAK
jgi:hypothetical protein